MASKECAVRRRLGSAFGIATLGLSLGLGAAPCLAEFTGSNAAVGDELDRVEMAFATFDRSLSDRAPNSSPEKCATHLLIDLDRVALSLSPTQQERMAALLAPGRRSSALQLESAHFRFNYDISGEHAVPSTDVSPANGVPDFVESVAGWAEDSWSVHVDERGFLPPVAAEQKIEVSFREMSSYGYTDRLGGVPRIVLHRNFEGFPANRDPEGSTHGAAKVTIAHELMHACQLAMSGWSEGSWLEADATYAEDFVFDEVDDYLRYLPGDSPIASPTYWAWRGAGYEDCLFVKAISETFGDAAVREFFERRAAFGNETPLASYNEVLQQRGSSLAELSSRLALWCHFSGANAAGRPEGFEEADLYPTPPIQHHLGGVPSSASGNLPGLGTCAVFASAPSAAGRPLVFAAGNPDRPFSVQAIALLRDGGRIIFPIRVTQGRSEAAEIPLEWSSLIGVSLLVSSTDALSAVSQVSVNLDDDVSVGIVELGGATGLDLLPPRPNPCVSSTTIAWTLPAPSVVTLRVHDVAGRRVRTLVEGQTQEAGAHEAVWTGDTESGTRALPGFYVVQLDTPSGRVSRKIHLLR